MGMNITLDGAIDRRAEAVVGPFSEIHVTHRRLRAGGVEIVRHFDGGWHHDGGSFLEVRVELVQPSQGGLVQIDFVRPWATEPPPERIATAVLYGDRLLAGRNGRWIATNDDDAHCWVAEESGLVNKELILSEVPDDSLVGV